VAIYLTTRFIKLSNFLYSMVRRKNVAEGAENPFAFHKNMKLPITRGGESVDYFEKYSNASEVR